MSNKGRTNSEYSSELTNEVRTLNSSMRFEIKSPKTFLTYEFNKKENFRSSVDIEIKLDEEFSDVRSLNQNHNFNFNFNKLSITKQAFRNYYAPKAICLCSFYNFSIEHTKILNTIHKYTSNIRGKIRKPIEKILENLIYETPLPPRGIHQIEYNLINEKYILTQPPANALPLISLELERIFSYFAIDQTLDIFTSILLEKKVVFFSSDKSILSTMIEGFLSLLHPFKYCHPNITVLPIDHLYILENFSAYVLGINQTYSQNFFNDFNLEITDNLLIVDLDNKKINNYSPILMNELSSVIFLENIVSINNQFANGINTNNNQNYLKEKEDNLNSFPMTQIPKYYKYKLSQKIINYIREIKLNTDKKEERENFIIVIQQIFYSFMVNLLIEYSNYLIKSDEEFEIVNRILNSNRHISLNFNLNPQLNIYHLFKVEEILSYVVNNLERPFYKKLFETKMFFNFIYKKLFPQTDDEKIEILHFDETIVEKNNRKIFSKTLFTPLLNCKKYEIRNTYTVSKSSTFSKEEMNYFKSSENVKQGLKYGQEIIWENDSEMYVIYHIFPKLTYDIQFFIENGIALNLNSELSSSSSLILKNLKFPQNIFTEVRNVTGEILANPSTYIIYSNVGYKFNMENKLKNIENYLYLSWIYIFAISFYYCEENEKPFRFKQLMEVIKKLNWIDEMTVNIIILSIIRYGDDFMAIKLFELLYSEGLMNNYTAFTYLINKLSAKDLNNLINHDIFFSKKTRYASKRSNISLLPPSLMHFINYDPFYKLKKRILSSNTFSKKTEDIPVGIEFETEDNCIDCNSIINIEVLCYDFEKMQKEALWTSCPICNNYTVPRLGMRLHREGEDPEFEKVVLYSPFTLKSTFSRDLMKEFGLNLDLKILRHKFNDLFWNSVFYFSQMGLPYDFMLPYQTDHECDEMEEIVLVEDYDNNIDVEKLKQIISPQSDKHENEKKIKFEFENQIQTAPFINDNENETAKGVNDQVDKEREMDKFRFLHICSNVIDFSIVDIANCNIDNEHKSNSACKDHTDNMIICEISRENHVFNRQRFLSRKNFKSLDFKSIIAEKNKYNQLIHDDSSNVNENSILKEKKQKSNNTDDEEIVEQMKSLILSKKKNKEI